jgi:hypothetical protein
MSEEIPQIKSSKGEHKIDHKNISELHFQASSPGVKCGVTVTAGSVVVRFNNSSTGYPLDMDKHTDAADKVDAKGVTSLRVTGISPKGEDKFNLSL